MEQGGHLEEAYLFNSSITLFVMGCLALIITILFRLKSHELNGLPKNLSANIFSKNFVIFNPYSEQKKIIHNFLTFLPILVALISLGVALIVAKIFESGFMLSFIILIICLNLITFEDASDVYQNSKAFIKAIQRETDLGVGDIKVFKILKNATPRISNYYLGLAILFIASAAALPYIWSSIFWVLAQFTGLLLEAGASSGIFVAYLLPVFLLALTMFVIQIFAYKMKNKLSRYIIESPPQ